MTILARSRGISDILIMMIMIMMMTIVAGSRGISDVLITGPSVLENGRQQWVDLACSFTFSSPEYKQLDIKWYFDNEVRGTSENQHIINDYNMDGK